MKWQGNSDTHTFMEWVHNASKEELVEKLEKQKERVYANKRVFFIMFWLAFLGVVFLILFPIIMYGISEDTNDKQEILDNVAISVCSDYGGATSWSYVGTNRIVIYCVEKNILLDGSPLL